MARVRIFLIACLISAGAAAEAPRIRILSDAFPPAQPTKRFESVSPETGAVGKLQRIIARHDDTCRRAKCLVEGKRYAKHPAEMPMEWRTPSASFLKTCFEMGATAGLPSSAK